MKSHYKNNKGVTLIEIVIALSILFIIIVPLINMLTKGMRGVISFGDAAKATQLAQEIMEETKQKKWDENEPAGGGRTPEPGYGAGMGVPPVAGSYSAIGRDGIAENNPDTTGANGAKLTWNDIDDYNGLVERPPRDVQNNIITKTEKFTRTVKVDYVAIGNTYPFTITPLVGLTTHYKQIAVTVNWEGRTGLAPIVIKTIKANYRRY